MYLVSGDKSRLYAGEALNLQSRLARQFGDGRRAVWKRFSRPLFVRSCAAPVEPAQMLAWQSCLVRKYRPRLNYRELSAP